eukprot:1191993-Amphidinium_carterae.1
MAKTNHERHPSIGAKCHSSVQASQERCNAKHQQYSSRSHDCTVSNKELNGATQSIVRLATTLSCCSAVTV